MKEKLEIKNNCTILSVLALALLLLLSPCKVRNFIQVEVGIPQTKVSNKSQTTITQSNCETFIVFSSNQTNTKPAYKQPLFLISDDYFSGFNSVLTQYLHTSNPSRNLPVSDVPLYLLFQNLMVYA
jgi:hypothetical protein